MRHILVETNWVVDVLAPIHRREHAAANGVTKVIFCEKDGDLLPWFKKGQESGTPREPLSTYYREAGVEVISDFLVGELAR